MSCEATRAVLSRYLDGDLDLDHRAQVDQHLAACARCRHEQAELAALVRDLGSLERIAPPADLIDQLRRAVAHEAQGTTIGAKREPSLVSRLGPWRIAAGLGALLLGGSLLIRGEPGNRVEAPEREVAARAPSKTESRAQAQELADKASAPSGVREESDATAGDVHADRRKAQADRPSSRESEGLAPNKSKAESDGEAKAEDSWLKLGADEPATAEAAPPAASKVESEESKDFEPKPKRDAVDSGLVESAVLRRLVDRFEKDPGLFDASEKRLAALVAEIAVDSKRYVEQPSPKATLPPTESAADAGGVKAPPAPQGPSGRAARPRVQDGVTAGGVSPGAASTARESTEPGAASSATEVKMEPSEPLIFFVRGAEAHETVAAIAAEFEEERRRLESSTDQSEVTDRSAARRSPATVTLDLAPEAVDRLKRRFSASKGLRFRALPTASIRPRTPIAGEPEGGQGESGTKKDAVRPRSAAARYRVLIVVVD